MAWNTKNIVEWSATNKTVWNTDNGTVWERKIADAYWDSATLAWDSPIAYWNEITTPAAWFTKN